MKKKEIVQTEKSQKHLDGLVSWLVLSNTIKTTLVFKVTRCIDFFFFFKKKKRQWPKLIQGKICSSYNTVSYWRIQYWLVPVSSKGLSLEVPEDRVAFIPLFQSPEKNLEGSAWENVGSGFHNKSIHSSLGPYKFPTSDQFLAS